MANESNKMDPGPRTAVANAEAAARVAERPIRAQVRLTTDDGQMTMEAPHTDAHGNLALVKETLGTAMTDFAADALTSLEWMTRTRGRQAGSDESSLNASLAIIGAIGPADELESALAMQMAGCHSLGLEMIARAAQTDNHHNMIQYGNLAVKLQRTFAAQIEALARLRGGANQSVRVEHVHVHAGGQAVVGNVAHPDGGGGRGRRKTKGQPDAQASDDGIPALRSPDEEGNGVPVPGHIGQEAVPDARGK